MAGPHKAVSAYKRSQIAEKTGVHLETVRYYETIGLLSPTARTSSGQRIYGEAQVKRLTFIRRSRELGFTLDEIRGLLELVDGRDFTCGEVKAMTFSHIDDVRRKISDLRRMERILKDMVAECDGGPVPECAILDALSF